MYFSRLAKYFSGKIPNSEKMDISEFVKVLDNIDISGESLNLFGSKFGSIQTDYENLFQAIQESEDGENKIKNILKYFKLPINFVEVIDYSQDILRGEVVPSLPIEKELIDIGLVERFLDKASEEDFARYLMIPLMSEMGFKQLSFYGKVTEKDYGIDMYPVYLETPFGDSQYLGIQFKKTNLGHGSTKIGWQDLKSELEDAFSKNGEHLSLNGSKLRIDGMIVVTSGKKAVLSLDADITQAFRKSYVRVYDREDVIVWCQKYTIPVNLKSKIEEIGNKIKK